jgi:hypothetical protein
MTRCVKISVQRALIPLGLALLALGVRALIEDFVDPGVVVENPYLELQEEWPGREKVVGFVVHNRTHRSLRVIGVQGC